MVGIATTTALFLLLLAGAWAVVMAWRSRDSVAKALAGLLALLAIDRLLAGATTGIDGMLFITEGALALALVWALDRSFDHQQRTVQELLTSGQKFEKVFRECPESMAITSMVDQRLIEVSRGFERLTGYQREAVLGHTSREFEIWDDPADREEWFRLAGEVGEVQGSTWRFRHRSGAVKTCLVSATVVDLESERVLISTSRDISDLKQAEQALRNSEERFATAFQASPDAVLLTSLPEGELLEVNQEFCEITGWARQQAVGRRATDLELWVDLEERRRFLRAIANEGRVRDFLCSIRLQNGEVRPFLAWSHVVEIDGRPAALSVFRDVSEVLRAEAERERLVRELTAKNRELELFSSTVSHDLKSPLITVSGFLDLLEKDLATGDSERVARDLDRIRSATRAMGQQLDEVLALSRAGRVIDRPEPVSLERVVAEVLDLLAGSLVESNVEVEVGPDLPRVLGDLRRLREVVQNLFENAIKFLGDVQDPKITVTAERRDSEVVFQLSDNGIGIAPEHQARIFGLFERLDPAYQGTGIGLALVRRIVEVHGGRVWVESAGIGEGSTFFVALPAADQAD